MSNMTSKNRIDSIDFVKGLAMILMALDHTRDFFHAGAFLFSPNDPINTTLPIFFTRWVTNICAPIFCFLAGTSILFISKKRSKRDTSIFLLKRGIWLVFISLTIVNFAWHFDYCFRTFSISVITSLGLSMIALSMLIYIPKRELLFFSVFLICSHDLLNEIHFEGSYLWAFIHDTDLFTFDTFKVYFKYPLIPWIGVMSLGFCFGSLYDGTTEANKRKKLLKIIGCVAIILFFMIRAINYYGDPIAWRYFENTSQTFISFMTVSKYPPSLLYLLITLGPSMLLLAYSENIEFKITKFLSTFGRVPFFYYIIHLYFIHLIALFYAQITGFGWESMILNDQLENISYLNGYGAHSLVLVYLVWISVIVILYPLCKKFDKYKRDHKDKTWLSYL